MFENVPQQTVVIQKYIQGTTKPLAGVVFLATDSAGNPIGSADGKHMTDENGRIVLNGLTPGTTLLVREVRTVDGYALNGTPQVIVVGVDGGSSTAAASVPVLKSLYTANSAKALDAGSVTTGTGNSLVFFDEPLPPRASTTRIRMERSVLPILLRTPMSSARPKLRKGMC